MRKISIRINSGRAQWAGVHEVLLRFKSLLHKRVVPPYGVVRAVFRSGTVRWSHWEVAKWEPVSITRNEYDALASLLISKYSLSAFAESILPVAKIDVQLWEAFQSTDSVGSAKRIAALARRIRYLDDAIALMQKARVPRLVAVVHERRALLLEKYLEL